MSQLPPGYKFQKPRPDLVAGLLKSSESLLWAGAPPTSLPPDANLSSLICEMG